MALYNKDSRLADALMRHPQLIPVINRLGVRLGVGDSTFGSICESCDIDPDFFVSVINTFVDKDYFPANPWNTFTLSKTIDYLEKTSVFYLNVQLPNIERHFNSLIIRSSNINNLSLLQKFFEEMKVQLKECADYDSKTLFPSLLSSNVPEDFIRMMNRHEEVEERLHDLLYFFVAHLQGEYDSNLCMAVVSAVSSLRVDYMQNNRIRSRILLPVINKIANN